MEALQQKIIMKWILRILGVHVLILFGLCYGLNAEPKQALEWALYQVIQQDLRIITQSSFSPYPFVSVVTSAYAVLSGTILFILFLLLINQSGQQKPLFSLMQSAYQQPEETRTLRFKRFFKGLFLGIIGVLMIIFHLFYLNDNGSGAKGNLYPAAFNSRFGIFIVQSLFSLWVCAILTLIIVWISQLKVLCRQHSV